MTEKLIDERIEVVAKALYEMNSRNAVSWDSAVWRAEWRAKALVVIAAIEASGYRVVPVEPTEAMIASAFSEALVPAGDAIACYAAMLAASPKVTT